MRNLAELPEIKIGESVLELGSYLDLGLGNEDTGCSREKKEK